MRITTAAAEAAVLTYLLDEHPRRPSLQEVSLEVAAGIDEPTVQRAIGNLRAASFLRLEESNVAPTAAVVSFDRNRLA